MVPDALDDALRQDIDRLGDVAHIVAPNSLHHLFIPAWQDAYPCAKTYAPPGLRRKRPDISFDEDLAEGSNPDWQGQIDQVIVQGNRITTEVVFFHIASGTVIFTDLIQHFPEDWFSGWRKFIARLDLMTAPEASVPRKFRLAFTNRKAARIAVKRILGWPASTVLMAHGAPVTEDATGFLQRAFRWL